MYDGNKYPVIIDLGQYVEKAKKFLNELLTPLPTPIVLKLKPKKRKEFSKSTREKTLRIQKNRCILCHEILEYPQFDHINGDSTNNDYFNCQALCPNCHTKKTDFDRKLRKGKLIPKIGPFKLPF